VLARPVRRSHWVLAKAAAVVVVVAIVAAGTWLGLLVGVAVGGGGISIVDMTALVVHLAFFGVALGGLALALATVTGRKTVAAVGAAGFAVLGFLINGFAPLVSGIAWLKYLSPFYYSSGQDPITNGFDAVGLVVLGVSAIVLTAVGIVGFRRRDLRA
jgi:ABC-2 type transport system permease protein